MTLLPRIDRYLARLIFLPRIDRYLARLIFLPLLVCCSGGCSGGLFR